MASTPAIPTRGLRHVALKVADVVASAAFYSSLFGMRVVWQPDPDNAYLSSGCDNLALHRAHAEAPQGGQHLDRQVDMHPVQHGPEKNAGDEFAGEKLSSLGIPPYDIVRVSCGEEDRVFLLAGDGEKK